MTARVATSPLVDTDIDELRRRLEEAEATLRAIRAGEVDALVIDGEQGEMIYTLSSADYPYRLLIEEMNEGAVSISPESIILYSNRGLAGILGRPHTQINGTSFLDLVAQNMREQFLEDLKQARHHSFRREYSLRAEGGREVSVLMSFAKLQTQTNSISIVIADLTAQKEWEERKRAEEEREQLLTREQELRQLAEEANHLKDEFLAIMSHELRNPLNVILGYAELLLRTEPIKQSSQLLRMGEAVKRNALTQSRLIRDLLDLSRLRSGKISLNYETVSLPTTINNSVETVCGDADGKQIRIEVVSPEDVLFVEGDPVRLEQIVWNLLSNSVKFTPTGGTISVRLAKNDGQAVLIVEDTGQGIDPSFLPHVFELFRQEDASAKRAQSGMGIGLAIVQHLVDLHGGSIKAHSAGPGKGAAFTVQLPLSLETRVAAESVPDLTTTLDQIAVLVVDDSEDTTEMLRQLLNLSGASVTTATSGHEALRIAAEKEFDVVVSDISMPGMDGFEFLRKLRQIPGKENVPALALTGFGRPEDIERAQSEGFFSHVTKPFELEALVDVLQKLPKKKVSR